MGFFDSSSSSEGGSGSDSDNEDERSMGTYDVAIIGGGIAGLYTAYKLSNDYNIILFEKQTKDSDKEDDSHLEDEKDSDGDIESNGENKETKISFGGRIKTKKIDGGVFIEEGAARIHNNHTLINRLIEHLGLKGKGMYSNLSPDVTRILRGTPYIQLNEVKGVGKKKKKNTKKKMDGGKEQSSSNDEEDGEDGVLKSSRQTSTKFPYHTHNQLDVKTLVDNADKGPKDKTYFEHLKDYYDEETARFIRDAFGYDSELNKLNSEVADEMFKGSFFDDGDYYVLNKGLGQIIDKLQKRLEESENVTFVNREITEIGKNGTELTDNMNETYTCTNLVCAIPKKPLQSLKYFEEDLLTQVDTHPLLRIYMKYHVPKEGVWFKNMKRTITDNFIRHIIPLPPEKGIIMISYTDGPTADMLISQQNDDALTEMLHSEIEKLYGVTPPKPEKIYKAYWEEGLSLWNTKDNMKEKYTKPLQPNPKENVFICGDSYSKQQGWIEGALQTSEEVIKKITGDVNTEFPYSDESSSSSSSDSDNEENK